MRSVSSPCFWLSVAAAVVIGQQGLEAGHFSPGGVETRSFSWRSDQRGPFGFDRGLAIFEAFQLLVESTHASFDGGAGGLEMGPPGNVRSRSLRIDSVARSASSDSWWSRPRRG